jgi:hypothetical protein
MCTAPAVLTPPVYLFLYLTRASSIAGLLINV